MNEQKTLIERMRGAVDALAPIIRDDKYVSMSFYAHFGEFSVSVYDGIAELAIAHGKEISVEPRESEDYPVELSVVVGGVKFFQIASNEELEAAEAAIKEARGDVQP